MALPLDGYIRVSQVAGRHGERFQSPSQQRESIRGWAKAHGVRIGQWHEDLDRSGKTMDRPGMNVALRRIEQGQSGGLIVARLDRFARTVIGGLTVIQELHDRGARVVSVAENLDPATPMGRAMLGLILVMAQWQWDLSDEAIALAQQRATSAGRFPGKPTFGYAKNDDGLTVIDEDAAQVAHRIFTQRAAGAGWRKIADDLIRAGVPTPLGRELWAPSTIQGIIRSEAYLGVFVGARGLRVEGAWPPLVDRELWEAANRVRGVRDDRRAYQDRLVAGIARCACCRRVLIRDVNHHGFVSYGCATNGCRERVTVGSPLLDAHITGLADERLARIALEPAVTDDDGEGARLVAARDAAGRELEAWRDDVDMRRALGEHDYREGLLARARARDATEVDLAEYQARRGIRGLADLPDGLVPSLETLPWTVRRQVVETLLHSVWVRRSKRRGSAATRHVDERVLVVWADDADRPALPSRNGGDLPPVRW